MLYLQIHAHFLFVDVLRRGRLFNCYARLLGASVGRDADVATMYFTDHDLVRNVGRAIIALPGDAGYLGTARIFFAVLARCCIVDGDSTSVRRLVTLEHLQ